MTGLALYNAHIFQFADQDSTESPSVESDATSSQEVEDEEDCNVELPLHSSNMS
jgi:hypothetical protein